MQQEIPKAGRKDDFMMYPRKKTENQGLKLFTLTQILLHYRPQVNSDIDKVEKENKAGR